MTILGEPKIDCHFHIIDPARFPYQPDTWYRPAGQEIATAEQFFRVMDVYSVRYGLVVEPNSGYGTDNRCMLAAIARSQGRLRGIVVVDNNVSLAELRSLKSQGIIGVAFNSALLGPDYYRNTADLLERLTDLDLILQIQVEKDQLLAFQELIQGSGVRLLIDHCGRPDPRAGLLQPGFRALLALGRSRRASVKLSGFAKFSCEPPPHDDVRDYVHALADAFTLDACVWGSDWPFLRAEERIDYGPLLAMLERHFPDPADRRKLLWETPRALLGLTDLPFPGNEGARNLTPNPDTILPGGQGSGTLA